jgi:hypothetical protein
VFHVEDNEVQTAGREHRPNPRSKKLQHYLPEKNFVLLKTLPESIHRAPLLVS